MQKEQEKKLAYFVHSLEIRKLWGYRDLNLTFNKNINIIIGPNASGKTTILNLLRYVLTVDLRSLNDITFGELLIRLRSFEGKHKRTIKVIPTEKGLKFNVYHQSFDIDIEPFDVRRPFLRGKHFESVERVRELTELLRNLVPAVWLPVSRRLPIPEDEQEEYRARRHPQLESVDMRLRELLQELLRYRLTLDAQLSERYKEFEKQVLQIILYSKQFDRIDLQSLPSSIEDEKEHLASAFQEAGLLDSQMKERINEHFSTAEESLKRVSDGLSSPEGTVKIDDVLVIPLIGRTKSMIQSARDLERDREILFSPLRRYESIANSFLKDKVVRVEDDGRLRISSSFVQQDFKPSALSSGEKQILILLTQALLWEDKPVVYVADEPELSLHVSWQSKLLKSLLELGSQIQIIVATHSPDIIGPFVDKVIDLGSK